MLYELLWDLRHSLRTRGVVGSIRAARRRILPPRVTPNPFDSAYGTDTGGLLSTTKGEHPSFSHSRDYWGTPPSMLLGVLARWSATVAETGHALHDYSFVDLGCGKGRALMVASELAFDAIIGVELDPDLVTVARANLELWKQTPHACRKLRVLHEDALAFALPDTALLLYLFNPFDAHVVGRLAGRLADAIGQRVHPIDIIYARPEHRDLFEALPGVRTLWRGEVPLSPQDTAPEVFETRQQECVVYRFVPSRSQLEVANLR
ncbi:MAG: hypothetical protein NVS9B15_17110 [Acidobacteriaceae bacterium]